ncbi:putative mitochondrial protein [Vitis vinifera]|uniref:Putative mitochondrial protein n=1 Tax=Vitis vinifera TaxID=29760 RepID=A0A438G575_VITVI|nr:putative mitochondrial protein [Vitis vinifera]
MDSFVARVRSPNPDKKGVENVVADHLSRLAIAHNSHVLPINDDFPEESLMLPEKAPRYAHIANYLVTGEVPKSVSLKKSNKESSAIAMKACGGHFASQKTAMKVLQSGFTWPSLFKDSHIMCRSCDRCQRLGKLTKRNQMPMNPILIVDLFYVWGIDFMGPFPMVVLKFLKENIFSRFGVPKAIISDGGTHFCNKPFETLLAKHGVKHKNSLQDYSWYVSLSPSLWQSMPLPVEVEYKAWWAIKRLNMDLIRAGEKRCLDLNEMEELRNDAYINSKVAKQRMKKWHDQLISNKEFHKGQRVLLYDSRLHVFPGKLKSRWIGPFIIHQVHPNGVVELLNSKTLTFSRSMVIRLKPFIEPFKPEKEEINLLEPQESLIREGSSEPSQAPPFVDQPMPHQEPPTGEAAEHHSTSFRRVQGVWDPAHSTRTGIIAHSTRVGIPSGCRTLHPDVSHPEFWPGDVPPSPDVSHPEKHIRMGEEGSSTSTIRHIRIHR